MRTWFSSFAPALAKAIWAAGTKGPVGCAATRDAPASAVLQAPAAGPRRRRVRGEHGVELSQALLAARRTHVHRAGPKPANAKARKQNLRKISKRDGETRPSARQPGHSHSPRSTAPFLR
jgi:hypothetical protein